MKAIAFINIKTEPGIYYCKKKNGLLKKFAHNTHQVIIGIQYRNELHQWYHKNSGWYQGNLFIKNPFYKKMTLDDFKILLKKIVIKLGFDEEGKTYFKGNYYGELTTQITDFMDRLMIFLGKETQNNNWSYIETDDVRKDFGKIKERFEIIDNYMKENNI